MHKFYPSKTIDIGEVLESEFNYALIIPNRPIQLDKKFVETLWEKSKITITVDGGTNRWLNFIKTNSLGDKLKHPTLITGDLDSCTVESLEYFSKSEVIKTMDQDATDFTKSLLVLEPYISKLNLHHIVVICENSGRLDQLMANISTLCENLQKPSEISRPIYMLSSANVSWMLPAGESEIFIPESAKKQWCSLIPIVGPTLITTDGLKWNMKDTEMKFGSLISSSNQYDEKSDVVKVECNQPVLWAMGICDED